MGRCFFKADKGPVHILPGTDAIAIAEAQLAFAVSIGHGRTFQIPEKGLMVIMVLETVTLPNPSGLYHGICMAQRCGLFVPCQRFFQIHSPVVAVFKHESHLYHGQGISLICQLFQLFHQPFKGS